VALDLPVELPRSRDPADSRFVALEQHILQRVLQGPSFNAPLINETPLASLHFSLHWAL
jgi:sulfonate transport system ATP-binding protein